VNILLQQKYLIMYFAIFVIAVLLISTIIIEMKKPYKDPNENEETKHFNDMLKD